MTPCVSLFNHLFELLLLAGFGNLQGEMDFWDPIRLVKVGSASAHCAAHCEWSPDSNHVLTAVLSPRIRVDNGYKIWSHDGSLIYQEEINELYQMGWLPALPGRYPDKPPVFSKKEEIVVKKDPAPAKYRHPHFSGKSASPSLRADDGPKKLTAERSSPTNLPAGFTLPYDKRDDRKDDRKDKLPKPKIAASKQRGQGSSSPSYSSPKSSSSSYSPSSISSGQSPSSPVDEETQKRIRNLTKKYRQIQTLKQERSSGRVMNDAQMAKLATEASIKEELARHGQFE